MKARPVGPQDGAQDDRKTAFDFRQFILHATTAYDLASTPPAARILKDSHSPQESGNGQFDWGPELSRAAQLRRGIDLKRIVNRFVEGLARDHGEKRAEQFIAWILDGHVSRIAYAKRGEIYADRGKLIEAIRAGGYCAEARD